MNFHITKKVLSLFLALSFFSISMTAGIAVSAAPQTVLPSESTTLSEEQQNAAAQKALEEQQMELEKNLAESEAKLSELAKESKLTSDYIDTLDQKIGMMNNQLTLLQDQITSTQKEIDKLKPEIEENEKQLTTLKAEIDSVNEELDRLNEHFEAVYNAYCFRLRAMYMSGEYSIISALLTCKDISSFLMRYEMIKAVAKSDTELLNEVNAKMEEICYKQNGLNEKKQEYETIKADLDKKNNDLKEKQADIEEKQEHIAQKKIALANDRAESDSLFLQLTEQNKMYTEFRNEDQELIDAVENEILALINGIKTAEEVTTAVAGTKEDTTSKGTNYASAGVYSKSDAVLNMKHPTPGHNTVSAGFPNYSSGSYHGGIDFPCPTGSKVVAAQSGVVIKIKKLNYSYGHYIMIYHGTDASGRSVVTLYGHNSSVLVGMGQTVKKGQQIAKSGSTGNSTGPHLHFEIRLDGTRVNPTYYLSK